MVERARLTPAFVFEAKCPTIGERWIADTSIKGFGLRLWSSKSGGQKAFAIRVSDKSARKIRRTFDIDAAWHTRFEFAYSIRENRFELGEYLDDARKWARNEIDKLKGKQTRDERVWAEQRLVGDLVSALPLGRAGAAILRGLRANNASQRYLDRLDKLFANHIPEKLKKTPLGRLRPEQVARAIVSPNISGGNVRVLRSFLSQIIERGASFNGSLGRFHNEFASAFATQWRRARGVRYPELNKLSDKKYQALFECLESERAYWQQAFAIRIYFKFRVPLSRILSAQWSQIDDAHWYPYAPQEKDYWFECRERIDDKAKQLLDKVLDLGATEFGNSAYWFPTRFPRSCAHIRSVEHVWQQALRKCGLRYYPLREFSRSYRDFNNPSYYIAFLRQYQPLWTKHEIWRKCPKESHRQ